MAPRASTTDPKLSFNGHCSCLPLMSLSNYSNNSSKYPNSIVDPEWEFLDPNPDIIALFIQFDERFFKGKLKAVVVKWSPRMTLCAGLCRYEGRSGMCSISLSVPLLKLRPRKDLVETLLHEMIHAYLFVTKNNRDRDGHGPEFQYHMKRINQESGTNITIYHSFHDEVRLYKTHWWKCNGPCQHRPPFYGVVKRSMNRAPGPNDIWWKEHEATCGGSYTKIREPEDYGVKKKKGEHSQSEKESKKLKIEAPSGSQDIRGFFSPSKTNQSSSVVGSKGSQSKPSSSKGVTGIVSNKGSSTITVRGSSDGKEPGPSSSKANPTQGGIVVQTSSNFVPFSGKGITLGGSKVQPKNSPPSRPIEIVELDDSHDDPPAPSTVKLVNCPVCSSAIDIIHINQHLDTCLT